jgi:GntR family transcriptional regulator
MSMTSPHTEPLTQLLQSYLASAQDPRPTYRKLADALAEAMRTGILGPKAHLPSERILAGQLGISRVTLRRALDEIAADGLLQRRQGARTAVARRVEKSLAALTGFSDELRARGIVPGQRWLSRQTVGANSSEAMALGLAPAQLVVRLERVRLADGLPIAIERAAVPQALLPSGEMVGASLYDALTRLGVPPVRGMQRIRAGLMTRTDADLLQSQPGGPLLIVERRCFLADGRPVEFTETRYNGASYDFLMELGSASGIDQLNTT